jgi:hypothetical protein
MGGARVWRGIVGARIAATHYSTTVARPYRNVIWNDFTRFRVHVDARNADLVSVRGYDGDQALRDNGRTPRRCRHPSSNRNGAVDTPTSSAYTGSRALTQAWACGCSRPTGSPWSRTAFG